MSALLALLLLAPSPRAAAAADSREVALVASPQALAAAEEGGLSLGELLDGPASRGFSNSLLAARRRYASMVRVLEADARELRGAPLAFDPGWLRSPAASFELVGIAPRLDLAEPGTCGEIRLVYRLAYARDSGDARKPARWRGDPTLAYPPARVDPRAPSTRRVASRLPMTLNVVLKAWDERGKADCPRLARRWLAPAGLSGPRLGAWLVSTAGPLPPATVSPARLREVQVNLQLGRWPAQDRQDMGGQYENLLRTFAPDYLGKDLIPAPLANTLDPARLARDRRLRDELRAWISGKENLAAIERGDARVPEKFLATRAVSVSPHGLWRLANRPASQAFSASEFPELQLRRLDALSCAGCHQSRSLAGFHLLGEDDASAPLGNALAVPFSPHLAGELARRKALLRALAQGRKPALGRGLPERAKGEPGGYGAHCGLGDPAFASWGCAPGLSCHRGLSPEGGASVGECLPSALGQAGDPCETGRIAPRADPGADAVRDLKTLPCEKGAVCRTNAQGFPGGECEQPCYALGKGAECGFAVTVKDSVACGRGGADFGACLAEAMRPAGVRACSASAPCRDDYVCARAASGRGACVPPWELPQLRPDGHPSPL